jgi:hypothetical protein
MVNGAGSNIGGVPGNAFSGTLLFLPSYQFAFKPDFILIYLKFK